MTDSTLTAHYLDPTAPDWSATIDRLWQQSGAPQNPTLIPPHFVKSTFPRMGGIVVEFRAGDCTVGFGMLFPRTVINGQRHYTMRLHELHERLPDDALQALIVATPATVYRPADGVTFAPKRPRPAGLWIGTPQADDTAAMTALYRSVWGSQPYPTDLFSAESAPGTALVATVDGQVAGFLLGFWRFGCHPIADNELAIESQVMAVDPAYRNHGLATRLKQEQARLALRQGVRCIHWTVDPLQLPNALLNFNHLHAVAGEFVRGYYPVHNELNLVTASRFEITWLPASVHGSKGLHNQRDRLLITDLPDIAILNDGPRLLRVPHALAQIAIAIPQQWTELQHRDRNLAIAWRDATDELFAKWIGWDAGKYVIYTVARDPAGTGYLIGKPAGSWVWESVSIRDPHPWDADRRGLSG